MSKIQISYKRLQKFDDAATKYLIENGYFIAGKKATDTTPATDGKFTDKKETILVANLKKVIKQGNKHFEEYASKIDDLQLDHVAIDEKTKVILKDAKGMRQFTVEGEKALKADIKKLAEQEDLVIYPRITQGDWQLSDYEKEAFSGLVIPEIKSEEETEEEQEDSSPEEK